ncbi:MAG TPA: primosomal protein N', partial [Bdellovibrionota bacterium]
GASEEFPRLSAEVLRMLEWASDYYHYPIGEVLRTFLPPVTAPPSTLRFRLTPEGKRKITAGELPKGKIQRALCEKLRDHDSLEASGSERAALRRLMKPGWVEEFRTPEEAPPEIAMAPGKSVALTEKQGEAVAKITHSLDQKVFSPFLLQGVTGSGKTEVYLRAAEYALNLGRSVLVVVPEIALTPQLVSRFRSRFKESVALLHSGISDGERSRQWHLLNRGALKICIGARSAALAPVSNLGLVVIDEEHDSALKQEDHLKYNARDLAIVRAKQSAATVVLGSATPSLESFHNAGTGRYQHLLLPERPGGRPLPEVHVVDRSKSKDEGSLSPYLRLSIQDALAKGGQVMLLLNRRGFSSFLLCEGCGFVPECPNCSVSLTNYKGARLLKCHYCGHSSRAPETCPRCAHTELRPGTLGTESLEEEVKEIFPKARVLRIDRESVERKGSLEAALASIAAGKVDIVIGTQIIAKGHDFPNISLVGVVNADSGFHLPDFRAAEKSFQLFTQMAGRAGRGDMPGQVVVQTYNPRHPSIVHATSHSFRGFAEEELRFRHEFQYPPFARMARLLITGASSEEAEKGALQLLKMLAKLDLSPRVEIMGPAPAVISKVQNRYRWNLLLKCTQAKPLHTLIDAALAHAERVLPNRVTLQVDVDPVSLM